ncbi:MAG: hypothetical protein PHQ44_04485 [Anaerovibrio sp.]|nr:hypothetical protein [Anaerovibrio sp.]
MALKKFISKALAAVFAVSVLAVPGFAAAAEPAADTAVQGENEAPIVFSYKHTSSRYGYSIFCPTQPKVVPASLYNEHDKGEVLIFEGSYNDIKKGWIVCINGYDNTEIPDNLGTMKDEEAKKFLKDFAATYGMEYAQVVEIANHNEDGTLAEGFRYGICGPTASQVEVDTNGDGVMDSVAVADNQMMKLFVPGQYGGRFVLGLIEEKNLKQRDVTEFLNAGIYTLQQWPTSAYDKAKDEAKKNPKK